MITLDPEMAAELVKDLKENEGRWRDQVERMGRSGARLHSPYEKMYGNYGKFDLRALRVQDMATMPHFGETSKAVRGAQAGRNPYPLNYFAPSKESTADLLVGAVEAMNDKMRTLRQQRWNIDVMVTTDLRFGARQVILHLWTPRNKRPDAQVFSLLRTTRDAEKYLDAVRSKNGEELALRGKFLFEERLRLDQGILPPVWYNAHITEDGLWDLIHRWAKMGTQKYGQVENPLVRIMLESHFGMSANYDDLMADPHLYEGMRHWLKDILDFTGRGVRNLIYNPTEGAYVAISPEQREERARHFTKLFPKGYLSMSS